MRRPLARIFSAGIDHVADLLEHVDEDVLLEGGQRRSIGAEVEPG